MEPTHRHVKEENVREPIQRHVTDIIDTEMQMTESTTILSQEDLNRVT